MSVSVQRLQCFALCVIRVLDLGNVFVKEGKPHNLFLSSLCKVPGYLYGSET